MILSHFGLDRFFENGRGFQSECAVATNLVSKVAQRLKDKSHETPRRYLDALQIYRTKHQGGVESIPRPFKGLRNNVPPKRMKNKLGSKKQNFLAHIVMHKLA